MLGAEAGLMNSPFIVGLCKSWWALQRPASCSMDTHRHGKSSCATFLTAHEVSCCSPRLAVLGSHCKIFVYIFSFNGASSALKDGCQKVHFSYFTHRIL